ncbi:MAG TPA: acyl-CoA dehydrogenase family protein [Chloroflexota bacterium]|nr:acyl-CoA dehydrogenase family protein [Chloroflexota bacterium]
MDFEPTEEQRALRQTIREFAQAEIAPHAAAWDARAEFPVDVVRQLGALGVMGLPFPEAEGGVGAGAVELAIVIEELARVDSSVAITVSANVGLAGAVLHQFGSPAQKERWLVPLARGQTLGALAGTEPGAGSDVAGIATTARLQDGAWHLNGTKAFITNAGTPLSAFVVTTAITGRRDDGRPEISMLLVPNGTPGYQLAPPYHKLGWHASDTRELVFDDCVVPEDHLVGPRGAGARQFLAVLDGGRVGVAALAVGLAQGALDLAVAYARERCAFGEPIARKQGVQFPLADLATEIEAARLLVYRAASLRDRGEPFGQAAAMAKLFASELAVRAANVSLQVHGGYGYMEEAPIARFYRDAKILTIGEGTSEIQRLVIARGLGLE